MTIRHMLDVDDATKAEFADILDKAHDPSPPKCSPAKARD